MTEDTLLIAPCAPFALPMISPEDRQRMLSKRYSIAFSASIGKPGTPPALPLSPLLVSSNSKEEIVLAITDLVRQMLDSMDQAVGLVQPASAEDLRVLQGR